MSTPAPARDSSRPSRRDSGRQRGRAVRRVLWIELALNLAVCAIKAAYGLISGSLAIASDAIHSLVDGGSNVIGLVVMHYASEPPDESHPYGHRKLEIIAAASLGIAIGYAAVRFTWSAIETLLHGGARLETSVLGFAVIGFTLVVNIAVATWEASKARQLGSAYLAADAAHTASDILVTSAVLASFAAAHAGLTWADPLGALAVIAVIAHVAWKILSKNIAILMDAAAIDTRAVAAIALAVPGVAACHRVRSRGTADSVYLDLHVLLDGNLPLHRAHELAHQVENALRQEFPEVVDVTIHMEPDDDEPEEL